jgi:hypothetical protein
LLVPLMFPMIHMFCKQNTIFLSILYIKATVVSVCLFVCPFFTYLLLISFSLTSFRFHYLSGVIPLAPVPCGVFWGVGEGRARWSTGRGGGNTGGGGQQGGASTGGGGTGEEGLGGEGPGEGGQHGPGGGARAGKDRAGGSSTGALCTRFTLVWCEFINYNYIFQLTCLKVP